MFATIIGALVAGILGYIAGLLQSNKSYDREIINAFISRLDSLSDLAREFYFSTSNDLRAHRSRLDYAIRGLVEDNSLSPIIGRAYSEDLYPILLDIFEALATEPSDLTTTEKLNEHVDQINSLCGNCVRLAQSGLHKVRLRNKRSF